MPWKTVLVPHDYSPCADRALAQAAELARVDGARLVLAHVTPLPSGLTADTLVADPAGSGDMIRLDEMARADATRELEQRARMVRDAGIDVSVRVAMGEIVDQILKLATDEGVDLIVMGTHGRTGLAHAFVGSQTERVIRRAPVPVLSVRERTDPRRTTSDVVLSDLATD